VVECLPSIHEALGSIPNTAKNKQKTKQNLEKQCILYFSAFVFSPMSNFLFSHPSVFEMRDIIYILGSSRLSPLRK
jgi:hypothetical protein